MTRFRTVWRYGGWLALSAAMLIGAALLRPWIETSQRLELMPSRLEVTSDRKVTSARSFSALLAKQDDRPLYTVNQPGLAIDIEIDARTWALQLIPGNRELYRHRPTNASVSFAGGPPRPGVLYLRGGSTLKMPGKPSFRINLVRRAEFVKGVKFKRFYLMNMMDDAGQFETAWAYDLLRELGLFHLHTQYARVSVNGDALGVFLLIEPPDVGIRRTFPGCAGVFRRQRQNVYRTEWTDAVPGPTRSLAGLRSLNRETEIDDPLDAYGQYLDVDQYLTWLAANSILRNGDTLDELFLFEVRTDRARAEPLRVMGWDYDDIAAMRQKSGSVDDPLYFSALDALDRAIHRHEPLRSRYRDILRRLLDDLNMSRLIESLERTRERRDKLDEQLPAAERAAAEQLRRQRAELIIDRLRERRAQLLDALRDSP